MKQLLRRWLGIETLRENHEFLADAHIRFQRETATTLRAQHDYLNALKVGLGRALAKVDPQYGREEIDPQRKAESNALGEQIIKKLKAEQEARDHTAPRHL